MNKLNSYFWTIISIISLALTSCTSDSDSSKNVILLKKIQSVDLGQIAVHKFYYKGTKLSKVAFDIQGQTNGVGYDKYSYTNDLITEIKTYSANNQLLAITTLSYNSSNQLAEVVKVEPSRNYGLRTVFSYSLTGTVVVQSFYGNTTVQESSTNQTTTFYLLNGEIEKKDFLSIDMNYTIVYVYDNSKNPFLNVTGYNAIKLYSFINNGLFGLNHNLLQQTTYLSPDVIDTQVDFELEYNNNNFPTSRYATGSFSGVYQYLYEYY
ncbi:MAG: hypothetical protein DCF13_02830 [Flavobacteriaceae bacterium]|jgi:hypothetical protein|nr:MAG: hypothetical protein DCF13_02830 [Flavobacteriaceae bacterium]